MSSYSFSHWDVGLTGKACPDADSQFRRTGAERDNGQPPVIFY
jgi:hypothetical protein